MIERLPHAVVAGIDLNGLGVVRALRGAGIPVVALDTDLDKPTAATRFGTKLRVSTLSGPGFIDELLAVRARFAADPVLILTQEASVATVSAMRERLAGAYRFTLPPHALMEVLLEKTQFQALAEEKGFPIPRAVRVTRVEGAAAARDLRFPCVLKPTTKHLGYGKVFAKAYKVATLEEVANLWSRMQDIVEEIVVQEWIEGDDADVYFCLQYRPADGRPSTSFTGRKICQWPMLVGGTASCIPASEAAAELTSLTDKFFTAAGFAGIGSMEYKRDRRDSRFYMIEPTVGRTDYQEEIAVLNGVNIPLAAYYGELNMAPPAALSVRPARAWRDPLGYANARKAGAPDPIHDLLPDIKMCDAYFRLNDPMPYFALKFQAAQNRLMRGSRSNRRATH